MFSRTNNRFELGPVVREAYDVFKVNGSCHIWNLTGRVVLSDYENIWNSTFVYYEDVYIKEEDQELIIEIIEYFKDWASPHLTDLTLKQAPWKEAYNSGKGAEITCEALYDYFKD